MTPFYQDDYITIYHGDCKIILPTLIGVRSIVGDPPYGMNNNTNFQRFSGGTRGHGGVGRDYKVGIVGDDKPFDPSHLLGYQNVLLFGYHHFAKELDTGSVLVWIKRFDKAFGSFLSDAELAWFNRGHGVYCHRDLSINAIANSRQHPTQKPVSLMRWCIDRIKDPGLICDPYAGSGSTLVAAKELGLKAIGVELVEEYCEVAAKRVQGVTVMHPAFTAQPNKQNQAELLQPGLWE